MFSSTLLLLGLASIFKCLSTEARSVTNLTEVVPTSPVTRHLKNLTKVVPEEQIYQVSVRHENIHICTGALVNPLYVLTVNRCVRDLLPGIAEIVIVLSRSENYTARHYKEVAEIIGHEDYDPVIRNNDIALLRLYKPLGPWKTFGYPMLPKQDEHVTAEYQWMLYGYIPVDFNRSTTVVALQKTPVSPFNTDRCKILHSVFRDTNFCAHDQYDLASCSDNTGGLLIVNNKLVGLALWPRPYSCRSPNPSMMFLQVSVYSNWIKTHIRNRKYSDRYPYPGPNYWAK